MAERSRHDGARVVLDGHGGDQLFQISTAYLADHFRAGRWLTLGREWRAEGGRGARSLFRAAVQPSLSPAAVRLAELLRLARPHGPTGVAPSKFHGKSTLAQALVRAGAGLLGDDVVPAEPGPPALLFPGVQHVRLWKDSAERLAGSGVQADAGGKWRVPADGRVPVGGIPALAIYLLTPIPAAGDEPAASRTRLSSIPSVMALLRHARLAPLLGENEAVVLLDRAAALAAAVPVYALEVMRDFARLDEAVAQICAWHPTAPRSAGHASPGSAASRG